MTNMVCRINFCRTSYAIISIKCSWNVLSKRYFTKSLVCSAEDACASAGSRRGVTFNSFEIRGRRRRGGGPRKTYRFFFFSENEPENIHTSAVKHGPSHLVTELPRSRAKPTGVTTALTFRRSRRCFPRCDSLAFRQDRQIVVHFRDRRPPEL